MTSSAELAIAIAQAHRYLIDARRIWQSQLRFKPTIYRT